MTFRFIIDFNTILILFCTGLLWYVFRGIIRKYEEALEHSLRIHENQLQIWREIKDKMMI